MGFGNASANRRSLWDRKTLAPGTHRERVQVAGWSDFVLTWTQWTGVGSISKITVYSSPWTDDAGQFDEQDPALNPAWTDETPYGAVFATLPVAAIGSDRLIYTANPFMYLLVGIVVAAQVQDFSLTARGQGRAG